MPVFVNMTDKPITLISDNGELFIPGPLNNMIYPQATTEKPSADGQDDETAKLVRRSLERRYPLPRVGTIYITPIQFLDDVPDKRDDIFCLCDPVYGPDNKPKGYRKIKRRLPNGSHFEINLNELI